MKSLMRWPTLAVTLVFVLSMGLVTTRAGVSGCTVTILETQSYLNYAEVTWAAGPDCTGEFYIYIDAYVQLPQQPGEREVQNVPQFVRTPSPGFEHLADFYAALSPVSLSDAGETNVLRVGGSSYSQSIFEGTYFGQSGTTNTFGVEIDPVLPENMDVTIYYDIEGLDENEDWGGDYTEDTASGFYTPGSSAPVPTCGLDGRVNAPDCARDTFGLYVFADDEGFNIQVYDALTNRAVIVVFPDELDDLAENPVSSPDGRMVLYQNAAGDYVLEVVEPDGKTSVIIFDVPVTKYERADRE